MSEVKLSLPRFDGKPSSDYHLWQLRLLAILESKDLSVCIKEDSSATIESMRDGTLVLIPTEEQNRKAAAIIINGLGDKPLRVVSNHTKDPQVMLQKLRERYASTKLSTRMSLMSELQSLRYKSGDMGEYIDRYTGLLDRLESMSAKVPEELAIIMFLHSMNGKFEAIIAAIRTMGDDKLTWDDVTARLLEEANNSTPRQSSGHQSALTTFAGPSRESCSQCSRSGHTADQCWWNPNNPQNKLSQNGTQSSKQNQNRSKVSTSQHSANSNNQRDQAKHAKDRRHKPKDSKPKGKDKALRLSVSSKSIHSKRLDSDFLLDSGASAHMCPNRHWFSTIHPIPTREIKLGDNSVVTADSAGEITIVLPYHTGGTLKLSIRDVLYVPELGLNLLSCSRLAARGISSVFHRNGCDLIDKNDHDDIIARADLVDDLYWIRGATSIPPHETLQVSSEHPKELDLWHNRLGHVNKDKISSMISKNQLKNQRKASENDLCIECISGKQIRGPFKGHLDKAQNTGEVIHSDVLGPLPQSFEGFKYIVSFIDEWTRHATIVPMKQKSDVFNCFKDFQVHFEKQYDTTIKSIHSDNGGEYTPLAHYAKEQGIRITRSAPYTPESNGIAERMNRTLIETVRTTLAQAGMSNMFWVEAMRNAVRLRNSLPGNKGISPYEALTKRKPNIENFRPFGCLGMVHVHAGARKKLDKKSIPCVLLCTLDGRNYRMYDPQTQKVMMTRNVVFSEDKFPLKTGKEIETLDILEKEAINSDVSHDASSTTSDSQEEDYSISSQSTQEDYSQEDDDELLNEENSSGAEDSEEEQITPPHRRYPARLRQPPSRLVYIANESANICHGVIPKESKEKQCHIAVEDLDSPTLKQALKSSSRENWIEAISEEFESLQEADTWKIVDLPPPGKRIFPSKFVLKIKRNSDRTIERYKARLVLLGHLQQKDIDFFETYSPVVDFTAVRIALVIACQMEMTTHHLDVKCAFLYGTIDEEIYMRLPEEYAYSDGKVCRLKKSIYGLKQAPRAWNARLMKDLKSIGYIPFMHAESIFWRYKDDIKVYLLVYVDDFLLITSAKSPKIISNLKDEIASFYTIKDLGQAEYFLGINLEHSAYSIKLSQSAYIHKILDRFNMAECKAVVSPMLSHDNLFDKRLATEKEKLLMLNVPYREAIGALMFLSVRTRPDIAVAVGTLAMHVQQPLPKHWEAVKRVLRYLRGSVDDGLVLCKVPTSEFNLRIYADADWATNSEDRLSRSGSVSQIGDSTIWWKSRKQTSIAASSCEAEYMALFESAKDAIWLRNLLCEFGFCPGPAPTTIFHDNQGSIVWAKEDSLRKVKHVALRYHFTHNLINAGQIELTYVESKSNRADSLTKPLSGSQFSDSKKFLGVRN